MRAYIENNIRETIQCKEKLLERADLLAAVQEIAEKCIEAYRNGGKILVCGNGGSASDAQHMAGELVGRYEMERRGIPAIAITANSAVLTAIANDYDYESAFAKQVCALGNKGDFLFGISTSGNSGNVVKALEEGNRKGLQTVGLTGENGGRLKECSKYLLNVPSDHTPRIQEMHITIIHILCGLIEKGLAESGFFEER